MKKEVLKKLTAQPGEKHKVSDFKTDFTAGLNKEDAKNLLAENTEKLAKLQDKLYAHDRYSILVIFQAMDAAGKDGTVKHVMSGINPQGCQVYSFKQPSAEDLDHDYLWRINKCLPERGRIGIFNRSHYEDVLIAKVHPSIVLNGKLPKINKIEDIDDKFWKNRYRQINDFERHLIENGTIILKFFLNVSHEEQEKRFLARLDDESKNWKFSAADLKEREFWNDYMKAYSDMLTHTSTDNAPWYVIPADNKWFMRYAVGQIVCDRIEELKLHYPILSETAKQEIENAKKILTLQNPDESVPKGTVTQKHQKVRTIKDKQEAKSAKRSKKKN
ncbi:polyphosphate kinase 2 family protein [Prevotella sp. 10(H)]|uniref:polyphosphate kinase 2 family protein n=1 Tax=Prevotella sp. 10(H) TaxID=1158294 RepID=UPI0004A6EF05|nr:polyphosphate kinase 2 family protein [Prevotella sp. 10(H)]